MVKVTAKVHDEFMPIFINVKAIVAMKVVDNQTVVFMKGKSLLRNQGIIVKETPEEIGKDWINRLMEKGKEIGLSGIF